MRSADIFDIKAQVLSAAKRIREHVRRTPLEVSAYLGGLANCRVFLKLENTQITGSFKLRGALNKFLSLKETGQKTGVVTASSGNHAAAVAYVLKKFGGQGVIYLPENASSAKIEALRRDGAALRLYGDDCIQSEARAKETAAQNGLVFISPYNDLQIIGGQGTIAVELLNQLKKIDAVLVPVGGGGLISGIAGYLKAGDGAIEIIGCQPLNSPVMSASVKAGKIIKMASKPTLADGTAGGIDPAAITFDICRQRVDDFILVTETEIKAAIRLMIAQHQLLVEGAAALPVAALIKARQRFENKNVVLIISGKKISLGQLRAILAEGA